MNRPRVLLVCVLFAGAAASASCDPGRAGPPGAAAEPIVVTGGWNDFDSAEERAKFMTVLDGFTARTGIPVVYRAPTNRDRFAPGLLADIDHGQAPDVAFLPQPGLLRTLAGCGRLSPLPDEVQRSIAANYTPMWQQLGAVDGTSYGVVFKAANKSTIWYDTSTFATAGVEPPKNWADFLRVSESVRAVTSSAIAIGGANEWVLTDWFENIYLRQAGSEKYDELAQHKIPWTDPSVLRALTTLSQLWSTPGLVAGQPARMDLNQSVAAVFDEHNAGMVFEGDFLVNSVASLVGTAGLWNRAKFFEFPSFGRPNSTLMVGGDIAVMTRRSAGAARFLQYLASPESAASWARAGGLVSPNRNLPLDTYQDLASRQSAADLANAKVIRFDLSDQLPTEFGGTPDQGLWLGLHDLLKKSPAELKDPQTITSLTRTLELRATGADNSSSRPGCG
ncbi:MAG TPA: ABC transporter substrate-binding protein [Mycobacteriales bacterium]|nr:ABC transporter substrate-binding protein [Mycobacteriales bacterium]